MPKVPAALCDCFRDIPATDVGDHVGPLYTMSAELRPLFTPMPHVVGRAVTVKAWPGDNLAIHGALGIVEDGDVLVVDWRGYSDGCGSGAQSLVHASNLGLRAVVIDGAWRDVAEIESLGLPVFVRAISAVSPAKTRPGEINVPVCCGGVIVQPGDVIVADTEAIAVIPRSFVASLADAMRGSRRPGTRTPEEQRAKAAERAAYYRSRFKAAGGVQREWGETDSVRGAS